MWAVSMAKIEELKFELIGHHHIHLNWPLVTFLISKFEKWLSEQWFMSNEEVIAYTNVYFKELSKSYFSDSLKKLEGCLTKCIQLQEIMLKNRKKIYSKKGFLFFSKNLLTPPSYLLISFLSSCPQNDFRKVYQCVDFSDDGKID